MPCDLLVGRWHVERALNDQHRRRIGAPGEQLMRRLSQQWTDRYRAAPSGIMDGAGTHRPLFGRQVLGHETPRMTQRMPTYTPNYIAGRLDIMHPATSVRVLLTSL